MPIGVHFALESRDFVRFPGCNHKIGVPGHGVVRRGSVCTQGVCSANDMVLTKKCAYYVFVLTSGVVKSQCNCSLFTSLTGLIEV